MKTIKVTGKAKMYVSPKQTKISLTIRGFAMEYGAAIAKSVEDAKLVKEAISLCGIDKDSLKTVDFYTSERTKRIDDKNGNSSYRHVGYDVVHRLNFIFDNNNETLGKVLYELSKLSINPRLEVSYVVKNPEKYKTELIGLAVADAKRKASAMADAAGVVIGDIVHMDYSYSRVTFESHRYFELDCCKMGAPTGGFDIDLNPDDEVLTDTVTIDWEIK